MDKAAFRQFLQKNKLVEDTIEQHISLAEEFEDFAGESPTGDDIRGFSLRLVEEKRNAYDNYLALARYGRFTKNDPVYVAVIELIDGSEVAQNLYDKLGRAVGEKTRDEIFEGIELPPLGTPSSQKPAFTQGVMERLERLVDSGTCHEILSSSLRNLQDEWYPDAREKYREGGNIDAYLERKGQEFIAQLEQIRDEGGLFFTQEIDDEVIDFLRSHPEIAQGVREGNIVYEVKIPYMTREYLAETNEGLKRYYYCHCPWVRESLKEGDVSVSPTFCTCSAGFHKKPWELIFGQPLQAEIVETVLKGDPWCKIAIHLPEQALEGVTEGQA